MKRYQPIVGATIQAARFDTVGRLPKGVQKTNHPRAPYCVEVVTQKGPHVVVPIELGDWVIYGPGGVTQVVNHNVFMSSYKKIVDIDFVDVTDEYRPAIRKEQDDAELHSQGSEDAEVSSEGHEGQDEIHPEGEAQGSDG
jgi:hypothetical protein